MTCPSQIVLRGRAPARPTVGQVVDVGDDRFVVAGLPEAGAWDDDLILVPVGTPLLRVEADLVRCTVARHEPERLVDASNGA